MIHLGIKYFIKLAVLYPKACNELVEPISAPLHLKDNTVSFEKMLQWRQTVDITVFDLTSPRLEPQISRSRDEYVTARPTGRV